MQKSQKIPTTLKDQKTTHRQQNLRPLGQEQTSPSQPAMKCLLLLRQLLLPLRLKRTKWLQYPLQLRVKNNFYTVESLDTTFEFQKLTNRKNDHFSPQPNYEHSAIVCIATCKAVPSFSRPSLWTFISSSAGNVNVVKIYKEYKWIQETGPS